MSQETGIFLRNFAVSQHDNWRMPTKFLQSGLAQSTVHVCAVCRVAVNVNQFPQAAFRSRDIKLCMYILGILHSASF